MEKIALTTLLTLALYTLNAQNQSKGFGLTYADSATVAKQKYIVPPRRVQGLVGTNKVDMLNKFPPIGNQGEIGSCASWATVYALRSYIEKQKKGHPYQHSDGTLDQNTVFNPLFIFNQVKELDKRCDSVGSQIGSNLEKLQSVGACKYSTFHHQPYEYPYCEVNPLHNIEAVSEANKYKIDDFGWAIRHGAFYFTGQKVNIIKSFLSQNFPLVIGIDFDSSFYKTGGQLVGEKYVWRETESENIGSHALVCIGFNDSMRVIQVYNSWGESWANKGIGYISYDLVDRKLFEAYIANPAVDMVWVPGYAMLKSADPQSPQESIEIQDQRNNFLNKSEKNFFIKDRYQNYNDIRIMPVHIDIKKQRAVFKVYQIIDANPIEIDVFALKPSETYTFSISGFNYDFTFLNIGRWNGIFSKKAVNYLIKAK